jgi:hypothetical protein
MSMTYWLQFKHKTELENVNRDLNVLCRETDSLDTLCKNLKVPLLSSFIDSTDAAYNAGVFDDQIDPDSDEPAYTPEQMQWFKAATALPTFRAIRIALLENPKVMTHLNHDFRIDLLEELDFVIGHFEQNAEQEFHLELLI